MALKIRNLNPEVILHYMIRALRLGPFTDDLYMTSAPSMDDLRQRVTKFMRLNEMREYKTNIKVKTMPTKKE